MADPDEVQPALSGLLLKLAVHTGERLAGHVLPHHYHVGVHSLAQLPKLVAEYLVAAVGAVAHYHVLVEVRHVVIRLLSVFGCILLGDLLVDDHGQHIGQRHDAPAVDHPVEHINDILRLYAPDYTSVAVLRRHHGLSLVALMNELHYLLVYGRERCRSTAVAHVIGVVVKREHGADKLRVVGAVYLQPLPTVTGGLIDTLCTLKVCLPIPLDAHVFLNKGNGVFLLYLLLFRIVLFLSICTKCK